MASNAAAAATAAVKEEAKPADAKAEGAPAAGGGGAKSFLPLIICVALMPVLAFAMTRFVLLPQLQKAAGGKPAAAAAESAAAPAAGAEGASPEAKSGEKPAGGGAGKAKFTVPMTKLLVNVAGTMGTRYLMTSISLVGNTADFKDKIEENKDQMQDLATSVLSGKTISDLEKPGARNVIRAELLTVFNNALGGPVVQEIYITELAIQ